MKIAYYVSNRSLFPPQKDQIAASITVVDNIIKSLKNRHKITLYAPKGSVCEGVKIIDLDVEPFRLDSNLSNNDWITKATLGLKQIFLGEIMADAQNYDLIHLHTEPVYLGMSYAKLVKTPILFTSHNPYHSFEEKIFKYYDKKIYLSGLSQNQIKNIPFSQKIPVIYNGIEIEKFQFNLKAKNYFLFLGRLVEDKGINTYLKLAKKNPHLQFYIAGRGDKKYEDLIKNTLSVSSNIVFKGMVARFSDEWIDLLANAKALVMPINYEDSCPLVPLEAMAFGTPVVAYNMGALPEQIENNQNGYLVEKQNFDKLNKAISSLAYMTEAEYLQFRNNARLQAERKFNAQNMAENYEKLYEKIVSDFKKNV